MFKPSTSSKINDALQRMELFSYVDVLHHLPRSYDNFAPTQEGNLTHKQRLVVAGKLVGLPVYARHHRVTSVIFNFMSKTNHFYRVIAFNRPYLMKMLNSEDTYTLVATFNEQSREVNLLNIVKGEMSSDQYLKPIYSLPNDIENYTFIRLVQKAFKQTESLILDVLPASLSKKYQFLSHRDALLKIHQPIHQEDIYQGLRVLKYEECLLFSLKTLLIRAQNKVLDKGTKAPIDLLKINELVAQWPYKLTKSQLTAVRECILDMNKPSLMYRLLQGDVGTGKTLVAILCLYANYLRGDQGALMAPTDTLARQHYQTVSKLLAPLGIRIGLLVGGLTSKEKEQIKDRLFERKIDILIGTHALFSEDVAYPSLGLTIIDEQHRFGVNQRLLLASKGERADLLLMSATPIPRTLALTVYGDLDVSTLTDFPFNERLVKTEILSSDSRKIDNLIAYTIAQNRRVYVIAPLIEGGEETAFSVTELNETYHKKYPQLVSYLHGGMSYKEKEEALVKFKHGETPILISTTVIEVGVDVKEASLMIIYDATHFGLAQLHQLRGRIGRDGTPATCLLISDATEEENEKLAILVSSNDGFKIAEEDLRLRGPGEMSGLKQSGLPDFSYVNLINDFKMFEYARKDAELMLQNVDHPDYITLIAKAKLEALNAQFTNV